MASTKEIRASSSFAVTCNLLSQFLKDNKAGFGCLVGKPEILPQPSTTTMSLLPGLDVPGKGQGEPKEDISGVTAMELFPQQPSEVKQADSREPEKAQLTIFYGGKVLVFDDFPADKARDLMQMASKGNPTPSQSPTVTANGNVNSATLSSAAVPASAVAQQASRPPHPTDMPMARRASLHRFLEKRKDRINARAPYQVNGFPDVVTVKKEAVEASPET